MYGVERYTQFCLLASSSVPFKLNLHWLIVFHFCMIYIICFMIIEKYINMLYHALLADSFTQTIFFLIGIPILIA